MVANLQVSNNVKFVIFNIVRQVILLTSIVYIDLRVSYLPAIHAVRKQATFVFSNIRGICFTTEVVFFESTAAQTPTKIARVPKLEKPHIAYVAMAADLG